MELLGGAPRVYGLASQRSPRGTQRPSAARGAAAHLRLYGDQGNHAMMSLSSRQPSASTFHHIRDTVESPVQTGRATSLMPERFKIRSWL